MVSIEIERCDLIVILLKKDQTWQIPDGMEFHSNRKEEL